MRLSTLVLPAINGLVWGGLFWMGLDLAQAREARMGHSDLGQVRFYVVFPLEVLIASLVPSALLSQTKWSLIGTLWSALTLVAVLPYLFIYSGGI
jgi:hypothetical protein